MKKELVRWESRMEGKKGRERRRCSHQGQSACLASAALDEYSEDGHSESADGTSAVADSARISAGRRSEEPRSTQTLVSNLEPSLMLRKARRTSQHACGAAVPSPGLARRSDGATATANASSNAAITAAGPRKHPACQGGRGRAVENSIVEKERQRAVAGHL